MQYLKVIRALKLTRCGRSINKYIVITKKPYDNASIDELVLDWANSDLTEPAYGSCVRWEFVTDKETIDEVLKQEIRKIDSQREKLAMTKTEIETFIRENT
jgi:hypothetical protein